MIRGLFFVVPLVFIAAISNAAVSNFPTFGISLGIPRDSTADLGYSVHILSHYAFNKTSPYAGSSIVVEVNSAQGKTLQEIAAIIGAGFAKSTGATGPAIDPKEFTIDGEKAIRFSVKPKPPAHQIVAYLTIHQGRLYLFDAEMPDKMDLSKPLGDLLASVKFIPLESPAQHLNEFFDQPIPVFGLMSFNGPQILRNNIVDTNLLHMGIIDMVNGRSSLNLDIQRKQIATKTFAEIRDPFSQMVEAGWKSPEPLQWHDQKHMPNLHVAQFLKLKTTLKNGQELEQFQRLCMLDLGDGNFVQILFTISNMAPDQVQRYMDLAERMLATIKVLPKQPTPKP